MAEKNTGIPYELFVQKVQQALFDAQQLGGYRTINVQHDVKLVDQNGLTRQFDLYWEFEQGGYTYRNVIECKDFANDIPIEKLDAFAGKLKGFPSLRGIVATRNGYQSGAIAQARANGIDLIVVRDEDPARDWVSADGTPLLRKIVVMLNCLVPAAVLCVDFEFDKEWATAHGLSKVEYGALATEINIADQSTGLVKSIQKIVEEDSSAHAYADKNLHVAEASDLPDSYLVLPSGLRAKILGYKFKYRPGYVLKDEINIEPEVLGVVEYVAENRKKMVLKKGRKTAVI